MENFLAVQLKGWTFVSNETEMFNKTFVGMLERVNESSQLDLDLWNE